MSLNISPQRPTTIRHPRLPFALAMLITLTGWWLASENQRLLSQLSSEAELASEVQRLHWQTSQLELQSQLDATRTELERQKVSALTEAEKLRQRVKRQSRALRVTARELEQLRAVSASLPLSTAPLGSQWMHNQSEAEKLYMLRALPSGAPLRDAVVTSHYGKRMHPVTKKRKKHAGIDFRAAKGTPVYATADGVVEWSGNHRSGLGTMVKLVHGYGFTTTYGHLSRTTVKTRQFVARGELIGYTGNTGLSSAPHLHYEVSHLYRQLDPEVFVNWSLDNYTELFARYPKVRWQQLAQSVRGRLGMKPQVFARADLNTDLTSG